MRLGVPWLYPDERGNWPDREVVFTIVFPGKDPVPGISEEATRQ